ncbi:putative membrane fusion protein [Caldanaerovirga acetigignens]|uniref:Putative membrane fusion protein n=2 Tax=Caldanaerovirga acetigignens TaxID=447595 RepID=A0A1M7FVJ4_9FIRM|nr:putative membrane fusion protein [Caldanaerovirga acetigignens]
MVKGMKRKTYSKVVELRSRKIRKKRRILLPLTVLFLCLAVLCILECARDDIYIAKESTVKEIISSEAVIVKNERVINAPAEGKIELMVKAGERVRVNAPLFKVVADVDKKQLLEREMDELKRKLENIKKAGNDLKLQNEAAIEMIEKSIKLQEKKLQEVESTIFSPMAGVISFNVDGYEYLLVPEKVSSLDYEDIENIKATGSEQTFQEIVKTNQAVMKIVDSLTLEVVAKWDGPNLKIGEKYTIRFPEHDLEIKTRLRELSETKKTAVFSVQEVPFELLDKRKSRVEIVVRTHNGIGVPVSALVDDKGQEGVLLFFDGKLIFKPVKVIAKDDKNAIVEGVKLGDRVVVKRGLIWSLLRRI